jgi:hypothetical protein
MAQVNKLDSNITNLRIAEEESYKVLPTTPVWKPYEPNSYSDFGGEITTQARNPINSGRQRKKGVVTDLDASGGFSTDLTKDNLIDLLQGFFFANLREKGKEIVTAVDIDGANPDEYEVAATAGFLVGSIIKGYNFDESANNARNVVTVVTTDASVEVATGQLVAEGSPPATAYIQVIGHQFAQGDIDVTTSGDFATYVSSVFDFQTLGLIPGEWIYVGGDAAGVSFSNAANNGFKRVKSVSENALVVDKSTLALVTEDNSATSNATIQMYFGSVLKNEIGSSIVRRTYQLERELGAPDDAEPTEIQYEYLEGAVPSEWVLNIGTADKITADLSFIAGDHTTIDGPTSEKTGTRPALVENDAYNTSSDFSRLNMSVVSSSSEAPTPLFAFLQEMTLTINNNLSLNKAVTVLGAFNVTAGTFQVDGSLTAYFANVSAIAAIRANSNVTLDAIVAKDNAGIAIDVPLITLGDGRLNVEQDAPITVPLSQAAATGALVDPNMNHTLLMVFWDYLPSAAEA